MGRYRKVDTRIWNDARFSGLRDDGKLAFLFVLTHPHLTSLGAMRATVPGLAAELGWPVERVQSEFDELVAGGENALIECDAEACFIGLPKFLKYNAPENPNVVKSWGPLLDLLPECDCKTRLIIRVESCISTLGDGFVSAWESVSETVCQTLSKGLPEPFRKGYPDSKPGDSDAVPVSTAVNARNRMPNPEPEPEPKPEQEPEPKQKDAADAAGVAARPKRRRAKEAEPVIIPPELDTPEARTALEEFREHRKQQRKALTPIGEKKLLQEWANKGAARFVTAVDHSIANGWQGLFEPSQNGRTTTGPDDPRGNFAAGRRYLEGIGGDDDA